MKPENFAATPPLLFRRLGYSQKTVWGIVVMAILVCAVIAWLHFQQQQALNRATKALDTFRQARIDLLNGFLHLSLGSDPTLPFDREQGRVLLEQAIASFNSSAASLDQQGIAVNHFQEEAKAFRYRLREWRAATTTALDETELRIAFEQLETQAERLDEETRAQLQTLFRQQETIFNWALGGAAVLLAGICGAVFLAGQSRQAAEAERRQVEESLRQSEARYRLIAANTGDVIWLLSLATGKFTYVSPSVQKLRGYTPEEVLTQTMADALTPDSLALVSGTLPGRLERFYAGDPAAEVNIAEVDQPRQDGSIVQTEVVTTLLTDAEGQVTEILGVTRDISERKRAEQAQQTTARRFQLILSALYGGLLVVSNNGRIEFANQSFCKLFELDDLPEALPGLSASEMIQEIKNVYADPSLALARIQEILAAGQPLRGEEIAIAGGRTYLRDFIPIVIDGQEYGRLWNHLDITEHKRAETKLRESEEWLRLAYDAADLGIWRNDIAANIYFFDARARKHYGVEVAEMAATEIIRRVHPDDMERLLQEIAATIDPSSSGRFATEYRVVHPDGAVRWLAVQARVIFAGEGEACHPVVGYGTSQDITERKQAEADLRQTMEELTRSNADLEQFAYVASHDLQEPLRGIAGTVQLLQRRYGGQLDERADEFIRHAVEGATRMQTLINDLLIYSRVGTRGRSFQPVELNGVLTDVLANLTVAIRESEAVISYDDMPTVMADRTQLIQLFQSLIANAIKFRDERVPHIGIRAERQKSEWLFVVADNGIGLEAQYFERIFGVFQRLHTRREYPGTGIGLALCKKIVERHGGRIWVESQPGQGTTFYFTLPKRRTANNTDDKNVIARP